MPNYTAAFEDRVRFNWGYWDGVEASKRGTDKSMADHYDRVYAAGYKAGQSDEVWGDVGRSSEAAWQKYTH